ncbi:MAG: hypothetical protein A3205_03660 [Methanomassiliicoccales archaeon Mx-03]|nr:MAG: hypothetical protein A3205_03660 [Methanomassiliicoccales archaeon Mx-03]
MRRLKSIDELYQEVRDYDLVITNDAALETALNARVDTVRMGTFAITPRHLAGDLSYFVLREREIGDLELVAEVSRRTELDFKYVYSEIQNFRDIRRYTSDVIKYITTKRSRRVYDAYESLPTRERVMSSFDNTGDLPEILRDKRTAVIGIDLFDDLDKHFVPLDCDLIEIFHDDGVYDIPEIREVGNDRQLAENAVDLIDRGCASDYAIVLKASSPIADAVRAALYRRGIPFVNSLSVRDLAQIRDYIGFLGYCMEYETVRVGQVKELFAALNGFFTPGREGFLLSKLPDDELRDHAVLFRDVMRTAFYDGLTFSEVMDRFCDKRARIQVGIVINSLGLADQTVTPRRLAELRYAVDNVAELKHNEEIPESEKTGVLIADCSNSVYIDKPVVIYLGMEQDWNVPVVGRRYVDAEDEAERNAMRLQAMLQQGSRRVYMVNSTKNGKRAKPCLTFDQVLGKPCRDFSDIAPLVSGRWAVRTDEEKSRRGESIIDGVEAYDRPFSKSTFNAYYSCPRSFLFRNLLPSEDEKQTEFGNLIHSFAELYACYPDRVREIGLDTLADMISDRYSGLSSPSMEEVDSDAVKVAMHNVSRYIDLLGVRPALDSSNIGRSHPNRFLEEMGLTATSTVCETNHTSTAHPLHGDFDLYWDGVITDYKTGKAKTAKDIVDGMTFGSGAKHPEFQPLIYLALASEMDGSRDGFNLFYAMENDVESLEDGYDIRRNMRRVTVSPEPLMDLMLSDESLRADLESDLRKEFKPHVREILDAIADMATGDPADWASDAALVRRVSEIAGIGGKDADKNTRTAINKIASRLKGGMMTTADSITIPRETLDGFLAAVDRMHSDAIARSLTELPAKPVVKCRDCEYFQACTSDVIPIDEEEGEGDE